MSKFKLTIIILAVAILVAGVWFYAQKARMYNSVDVHPDWLIYKSDKYGFEFKYPLNYEIRKVSAEKIVQGDSIVLWHKTEAELTPAVWIYLPVNQFDVSALPKSTALSDYSTDYQAKSLTVLIHRQETQNINGLNVLKQTYSAGHWIDGGAGKTFYAGNEREEDHWTRYIFTDGHGLVIILKSDAGQKADSKANVFLATIANTFKFTENGVAE